MKIYQCIHKYAPHIPKFEAKHGINDKTDISFKELRKLIIEDGYASSYILKPALEHKSEEVFFTIWDYQRLQYLWAKENGMESKDLSEIKLAQIKSFKPDVFYNMSPFCDDNFIEMVKLQGIKCKYVCWNGFVEKRPRTYSLYDVHLTLHKPFVDYWHQLGLKAYEFQPAIPDTWHNGESNRIIDVLFYGQYSDGIFGNRMNIVDQIVAYAQRSKHNIDIHLQYQRKRKVLFKVPKYDIKLTTFPKRQIILGSKPPIYGESLYSAIKNSKIVVNTFGNNSQEFKSNMRVFEAIGHGAFLISERGNYPKGLEPDVDFYTYDGFNELKEKIEYVLGNWDKHQQMALIAAQKMRVNFSKENQWKKFKEIIAEI